MFSQKQPISQQLHKDLLQVYNRLKVVYKWCISNQAVYESIASDSLDFQATWTL